MVLAQSDDVFHIELWCCSDQLAKHTFCEINILSEICSSEGIKLLLADAMTTFLQLLVHRQERILL